uniref:Fork-head domain-containing protein n=1 Tax=Eptatretus burgeri TaxID=7764 RepID=A0A8C4WSH5_EPTBU
MSGLERINERGAKDPEIETAQQLEVASQQKPLGKRPLKVSRSGKAAGTSYAALIASVLQTAPERRLTLPEIADELRRRHPCFAGPDTAWRNSVRHTLSVSGAFVKVPRDPARPWAKANYWALAAALDDYLRPDGTFRLRRRRRTRTSRAAFASEPNGTSEVKFRSSFSIETLLGSPSPGSICPSTPPSCSFGPGLAPVRFTSAQPKTSLNLLHVLL